MPKRGVCNSVFIKSSGRRESRNKAASGKRDAGSIRPCCLKESGGRHSQRNTRRKLCPCTPGTVTETR